MRRLKKHLVGPLLLVTWLCTGSLNIPEDRHASIPGSNNSGDTLIFIAHRGISCYYPENSLQGVEASVACSFHGVEVDISRSADSLIVFHDENGKRLLGIDKKIASLKTSELKKYPLLHHGKQSQSYIMTVRELLQAKKKNLFLYFDMKVGSFRDAAEIARLIRSAGCSHSVIVASSEIDFIFSNYSQEPWRTITTNPIGYCEHNIRMIHQEFQR